MSTKLLFYYFGDDEAYFRTIQGEFRKNTRLSITYKRFYESDEKKIQSLFTKVFNGKPVVVFIDFSKQTQDYLHLSRLLVRTKMEHQFITVGLVDYLSPPEILAESIATGVSLSHIKSAESYDVIFDIAKIIVPQEITGHGYATANLSEIIEAGIMAKVGHIQQDSMHIETDFVASKGDRLKLNHYWNRNNTIPSKEVFVSDTSTSNLFYHTKNSLDLSFIFVDEFIPPEGMVEDIVVQKKKERDESIIYHKKLLSKWIEANKSKSQEKKSKVLVVDRQFSFYNDQTRTDKFPYIIRCIPFFTDYTEELERLRPQVIAFAIEEEKRADSKNTNESMLKLFEIIRVKFPDSNPFIVIFNCPISSTELQKSVNYNNAIATSNDLSVEVVVRMAEMYEKKNANQVSKDQTSDGVFLKKNNTASIAEIIVPIKIVKLSETDIFFHSDNPIPAGTNLHLTSPVSMYVHVLPAKLQGKTLEYQGLIHSLGEIEKMELRRYVNTIFFRDHDEKKQAEMEEYKRLNEAKLQEKSQVEQSTENPQPSDGMNQQENTNDASDSDKVKEKSLS